MAGAAVTLRKLNLDDSAEVSVDDGEQHVPVHLVSHRLDHGQPAPHVLCEGDAIPHIKAVRGELRKASRYLGQLAQSFCDLTDAHGSLNVQLDAVINYEKTHAAEQNAIIEQWKAIAFKLRDKIVESEKTISVLEARCTEADLRAAAADDRAALLERAGKLAIEQAALAEKLSAKIDSNVVVSFGHGSRSDAVLRAVMSVTSSHSV